MLLGPAVDGEPKGQPDKPHSPRKEKRPTPSKVIENERNQQRRQERPDVRAGVEQPGRQRPLLLGKPLRHRLDGPGKIARLTDAQGESRQGEPDPGPGQRVRHRGGAPDTHGDREARAGAPAVHEAADDEQADRVGEGEGAVNDAILELVPADLRLQRRRQNTQHQTIEVVDRRRKEEQCADDPPIAAEPRTPDVLLVDGQHSRPHEVGGGPARIQGRIGNARRRVVGLARPQSASIADLPAAWAGNYSAS